MARTTHQRKALAKASRHTGRAPSQRLLVSVLTYLGAYLRTHLSRDMWVLLAILVAALLLRILPLGAFSTEYDEGVYWLSLRAMANGHPLYTSIYNAQAPFFFASLYPPFLLLGQTLIAARIAIVLYSLVGIGATYFIGHALGGRYVGLAAAAIVATDPLYLMQSRTLEAEMPSLALMLLGIALALEAGRHRASLGASPHESHDTWLIIASGALLGLALMVKLLAVVGFVPAALALAWPARLLQSQSNARIGQSDHTGSGRLRQLLWTELRAAAPSLSLLLAGFVGACLLVLVPLLANLGTVYHQAVGVYLGASQLFGSPLQSNLHAMMTLRGEGLLALAAAIALAVAIWRRSPLLLLVTAWALATFAALLRQPTPWTHHFVFLVPPLALLCGLLLRLALLPGASGRQSAPARPHLASRRPTLVTYGPWVMLVVFGVTLFTGMIEAAVEDQRVISYPATDTVRIASILQRHSAPGEPVVTDDPYLAGLAGRSVPPQLIDTSQVRIQTGNLTAKQIEQIVTAQGIHAILFASGRFAAVPGLRAWVAQHYAVEQDFGGGRVLYVKRPQGSVFQ